MDSIQDNPLSQKIISSFPEQLPNQAGNGSFTSSSLRIQSSLHLKSSETGPQFQAKAAQKRAFDRHLRNFTLQGMFSDTIICFITKQPCFVTKQSCLEQKQFALPQIKLALSRSNRVWNKNSLLCRKSNLFCHEAIVFETKTVCFAMKQSCFG
jgi:hypothetical protein